MSLLWGAGSPPCWRVLITLEEKKLQGSKHKLLSLEKGEHKSQDVLEINPRGQGNKLIPDSPAEQALMYQRILKLWEDYLEKVAAGSYLVGAFSLADAFRFGLSVGCYPKLVKYYSLLKDRPSIKASWPPHWLDSPQGFDILKDL